MPTENVVQVFIFDVEMLTFRKMWTSSRRWSSCQRGTYVRSLFIFRASPGSFCFSFILSHQKQILGGYAAQLLTAFPLVPLWLFGKVVRK
jgi:hypothetical protein